ncbi:MAG: 2Fe-2S iron-sulfur cluster binding domain-containing protein [Planctomycetota bacterium]|nr:2Fe-2S iron-sulfur cluster binding domain-containing protein [Planctomycetota bacterium]
MGRLVIQPALYAGEVPPGKSVLQVLLELRAPMHYSCRRGLCGQDLIRVLAGGEHLNPVGDLEDGTLELLQVKGQPYRMACCARVVGDGEVVVEVV